MDIKIDREETTGANYHDSYARETLGKFFVKYPFIESIKVFFRGKDHPYKKVKLQARLKGKDVFVEARGDRHDVAIDAATVKLRSVVEKYKTKRYKKVS
jgi:ribosome-associated translation inhibitor RaiA